MLAAHPEPRKPTARRRGGVRYSERSAPASTPARHRKEQMIQEGALLARVVIGTVLGAVIGDELHVLGRPAGLRTHPLVALASTAFVVVSTHVV